MSLSKTLSKDHWVIIPAFNEARNLEKVLRQVIHHTDNIVLVDDGSSDSTSEIAARFTQHVLRHTINLGKGAALKTGCLYAIEHGGATGLILMDADDQHDAKLLPSFSQLLLAGEQLIFGVRAVEKMPPMRRFSNLALSYFLWMLYGRFITDILSGYQAISTALYQNLKWHASGYEIEAELAVQVAQRQLTFATIKIPTMYHDRSKGMTLLDGLQLMVTLCNWRIMGV